MAEEKKEGPELNKDGSLKTPAIFESRYPALQLHGREVKDEDGVRSIPVYQFKPAASALGADAPHHAARGYFVTSDPATAAWLRKHKNHAKPDLGRTGTFKEIQQAPAHLLPNPPKDKK